MISSIKFEKGRVEVYEAWTVAEVRVAVEAVFSSFSERLPEDLAAKIVIKPNLNNDLVALVGNSTDLRVMVNIIEVLQELGYTNITVADGSNVGIDRREISTMKRLRFDRLESRYGVKLVNLNRDPGTVHQLHAGASPEISNTILNADFLISVPKIKTHAEAQLSCAMKNWVGIVVGQQKREVHLDLAKNIWALNEAVQPDLIIVDGLVGMEGNGPGDGVPFRFGKIIGSDNGFLNDLTVAKMVGMPLTFVPYLVHAKVAGRITRGDEVIADGVETIRVMMRAPERSKLAVLSELRSLRWLKSAVQPALKNPKVIEAAYKLKITQDVYSMEDDSITGIKRVTNDCGECKRCEQVCPTGLSAEEIGVSMTKDNCIDCLYCWWICPDGTLELEGDLGYMKRHIDKYKGVVETI